MNETNQWRTGSPQNADQAVVTALPPDDEELRRPEQLRQVLQARMQPRPRRAWTYPEVGWRQSE